MSGLRGQLLEMLIEPGVSLDDLRRRVLEAVQPSDRPARLTYEEFLAWLDEDTRAEWVDGELVMSSPASYTHQDISSFLLSILRAFVEAHHLGVALGAPFQMRLSHSGREPDLLFLASAHADRRKPTYLDGPADVVVEILSPESATRDRGEKFFEYEAAGIPEYWLIDPMREQAEFYQLGADRLYRAAPLDAGGRFTSKAIPGFELHIAWLWQPPAVLEALRELGLV
jgi:Uma2 family endonuclease